MNIDQFAALYPLLILAAGATTLMLQIAIVRSVAMSLTLTVITLILAAASCKFALPSEPTLVTPLLMADRFAYLFCALFCLAAAATAILSRDYIQQHGDQPEEYFLLLLLSTLGACVLAYATHVASLLLGLELLSVSLYALIAYPNKSILPLEAATKYLVLSGAASATILFGFALLYAMTGTLEFTTMGLRLDEPQLSPTVLVAGAAMVFSGLAFKLSVVPFHLWTPDVYHGAPAPISGFLASVAKAAVLVVLLRLFIEANLFRFTALVDAIGLLAIVSMVVGNLLALLQTNIKRMLAYSSIAHIGYLLIVFVAGLNTGNRDLAVEAAVYYLVAYTATTIAAFGLLTLISAQEVESEKVELQHISGLFWHRPLQASLMLVALLSLAGIPLTAGFIGKFYLFSAAVSGNNWGLLSALIIGSGIGIYYYLRAVYYMTRRPEPHQFAATATGTQTSAAPQLVLPSLLIAVILLLGVLPQRLITYIASIL